VAINADPDGLHEGADGGVVMRVVAGMGEEPVALVLEAHGLGVDELPPAAATAEIGVLLHSYAANQRQRCDETNLAHLVG
jgi:hypothetical protein